MDEPTSPWRGHRVFVTGCTGFLGGAVVRELLAHNAEVIGLVRDRVADAEFTRHKLTGRVHIVHGRVEDLFRLHSALAVYEARAVFHLANADPTRPDRGLTTVIEATRRYDPRVPIITARPISVSENATISPPVFPPVPLGVARFGEIFGGGDRKVYRIVPATIIGLVSGERAINPGPSPSRDFLPVREAARACLQLGESLLAHPGVHLKDVSFRSGWSMTDKEMAEAVRDVFLGNDPNATATAVPENPLGWRITSTLSDALADTIGWYREFLRTRFFGTRTAELPQRAAA